MVADAGPPLVLMALGLVLWLAVTATIAGISIQTIGVILFVVGAIWLVVEMLQARAVGPRDRGGRRRAGRLPRAPLLGRSGAGAERACASRSSSATCPRTTFSRAAGTPNHATRSTSGNSATRPDRGGHSSSNVPGSICAGRSRPRPRRRSRACPPAGGSRRARAPARPAARARAPRRTRAARPRAGPPRRPARPWGSTRRRRPCAPRTARPCDRAGPRARRRARGTAAVRPMS